MTMDRDRYAKLWKQCAGLFLALALAAPTVAGAQTAPPTSETVHASTKGQTTRGEVCGTEIGGKPKNVQQVVNQSDRRFVVRGNVDFNTIEGSEVAPVNFACAESTGVEVKTIVVALQINLYEPGARSVAPENAAVALNVRCSACVTRAEAVQSTTPLDEDRIEDIEERVERKVRALNRELDHLERAAEANTLTLEQANAKVDQILAQFSELKAYVESVPMESEDDD